MTPKKALLLSAGIFLVLAVPVLYFIERAGREKAARVWAYKVARVATLVEEYRQEEGHYPVAACGADLCFALSLRCDSEGIFEKRLLSYWSDGSHYSLIVKPAGPGPVSGVALVYEVRDGDWHTWPKHLTESVRERLRESFARHDSAPQRTAI